MFKRVFVANRGEIAVRVIRACRDLGIEVVVGVSEADRESMAARLADRAVCIGPPPSTHSYLRPELLITAAKGTGCDAIHPGYGFLSEQASFNQACHDNGIIFIGPSVDAIQAMGDKLSSIALAKEAGVPVIPGSGPLEHESQARDEAERIGYPCMIKASAGGGGRGMRVIRTPTELHEAFSSAKREAQAAFGDATLYMEKFIEQAKHIEIQVMGDTHGNVAHLFERECSIQRRHQKLIEEATSPVLSPQLREAMGNAALALADRVGYYGAGTVEFVYDVQSEEFYFLEMNTRIQVEHPVTEAITGVDLVAEQIRVAAGARLSFSMDMLTKSGHAIECRINAENPFNGFAPAPGEITVWQPPAGEGIRLDSHCYESYTIPPFYDSLIAKLIVHAPTRRDAVERMIDALDNFNVQGIATTIPLQKDILLSPEFQAGTVSTRWLESYFLPDWLEKHQTAVSA